MTAGTPTTRAQKIIGVVIGLPIVVLMIAVVLGLLLTLLGIVVDMAQGVWEEVFE